MPTLLTAILFTDVSNGKDTFTTGQPVRELARGWSFAALKKAGHRGADLKKEGKVPWGSLTRARALLVKVPRALINVTGNGNAVWLVQKNSLTEGAWLSQAAGGR